MNELYSVVFSSHDIRFKRLTQKHREDLQNHHSFMYSVTTADKKENLIRWKSFVFAYLEECWQLFASMYVISLSLSKCKKYFLRKFLFINYLINHFDLFFTSKLLTVKSCGLVLINSMWGRSRSWHFILLAIWRLSAKFCCSSACSFVVLIHHAC